MPRCVLSVFAFAWVFASAMAFAQDGHSPGMLRAGTAKAMPKIMTGTSS